MDTHTLRCFQEICEGNTFQEVAENHYLSQSGVSKAIARLEDELGVELLKKNGRRAAMTEAGKLLHGYLSSQEKAWNALCLEMKRAEHKICVRFTLIPGRDLLDLNLAVDAHERERKRKEIVLLGEKDPQAAWDALKRDETDLIISHDYDCFAEAKLKIPVYPDRFLALLPKDHPLAGRESVELKDLCGEKIFTGSNLILLTLKELCQKEGLPMPQMIEYYPDSKSKLSRTNVMAWVRQGYGISFFYYSDIFHFRLDSVAAIPVKGSIDQSLFAIGNGKKEIREEINRALEVIKSAISG
ncbi:MAG: LysR family transcriptional regulator [Faecousia sp.]